MVNAIITDVNIEFYTEKPAYKDYIVLSFHLIAPQARCHDTKFCVLLGEITEWERRETKLFDNPFSVITGFLASLDKESIKDCENVPCCVEFTKTTTNDKQGYPTKICHFLYPEDENVEFDIDKIRILTEQ